MQLIGSVDFMVFIVLRYVAFGQVVKGVILDKSIRRSVQGVNQLMKQILDFLYYYMYQLNRRGYKKFNYENARAGLTVLITIFFLSLTNLLDPIVKHVLLIDVSNNTWTIASLLTALVFTFYFTKKYYGPNGSRKWVVDYYDKNTTIRKQNSVLQSILLAVILVGLVVGSIVIGLRLQEYLNRN